MSKIPKEDVIPNGLMAGAILFFSGLVAFGLFGGSSELPFGLLVFLFLSGFATVVIVYYWEKMESKERDAFLSNQENTLLLEQTLLKWMEEKNALKIIIRQVMIGIVCLIAGYYLFRWIFAVVTSDNLDVVFVWFGEIALLIVTASVSAKQFQYALLPQETLRICFKYSLIGFACVASLLFLVFLSDPDRELVILFGGFVLVFLVIGLLNGLCNFLGSRLEGFDQRKYQWLVSNEADVMACESGYLSYRHTVLGFWRFFPPIGIVLFGLLPFLLGAHKGELIVFCLCPLIILVGMFLFVREAGFFFSRNLSKVQGTIKRKEQYKLLYSLTCDNISFFTDAETWNRVSTNKEYVLWYLTDIFQSETCRVLAYEEVVHPGIQIYKGHKP